MNMILVGKIFEVKGIIETLAELANDDEQYNYPMIEKLETKFSEVIYLVEKDLINQDNSEVKILKSAM